MTYTDLSIAAVVRRGKLVTMATTGSGGDDGLTAVDVEIDLATVERFVADLATKNPDMTDDELTDHLNDELRRILGESG